MSNPIARAIDVGHGNTKFTTSSVMSKNGKVEISCDMFPSLAPAAKPKVNVAGSILTPGQSVDIKIDNAIYTVGKDVELSVTPTTSRILDPTFALSNVYAALVNGALYYMGVPKIDMLVLGLPMNTYEEYREPLRERMTGGHTLPNPARKRNPGAPEFVSVEVSRVKVLPQPVGAFFNYCLPRGLYTAFQAQRNLVLDIGHGTFDWFLSKGNQPILSRCGASYGGVHKIVDAVANAIDPNVRHNIGTMEDIDLAIRTGNPVHIKGKPLHISKDFQRTIQDAVRDSVASMMREVGDVSDVTNILVTGGGATIFIDELKKTFAGRELLVDSDPVYSNVRGFQMAGEQWLQDLVKAA